MVPRLDLCDQIWFAERARLMLGVTFDRLFFNKDHKSMNGLDRYAQERKGSAVVNEGLRFGL